MRRDIKTKEIYEAPVIEMIEVRVEKGFAASQEELLAPPDTSLEGQTNALTGKEYTW